ncbi:hypothetical protein [Legionella spiritensis]|uniref:hypothetical protein n=1 Tax=Legionella spiritensis TaxID=452 RepID=UPI000F7172E7|nr:hypothetical protein [Legionella spiritensis]VEG89798.1 Uncharacterised protein [Legionella spiritensis]
MLIRSQIATLVILRSREGNLFSQLPLEMVHHIYKMSGEPTSDIGKLLHAVISGHSDSVKTMLDANPRLLLQASDVITPSEDTVAYVTPYECALGAGDVEMAVEIASYFSRIKGGQTDRASQYARYKWHIDHMPHQPVYDFKPLFQIINNSSDDDVRAALNKNFEHPGTLNDALMEFRKAFKPGIIKSGMHFNYMNMLQVLETFHLAFQESDNVVFNDDRYHLGWLQVCGFIMRGLPACDRQALAQGLQNIVLLKKPVTRSFKCSIGDKELPVKEYDSMGFGFDFTINELGCRTEKRFNSDIYHFISLLETYYQTKLEGLQNLYIQNDDKDLNHIQEQKSYA